MKKQEVDQHNKGAWDYSVDQAYRWSQPIGQESIFKAKNGDYQINLSPGQSIPHDWIGSVKDQQVLLLAGGGGQQAPLLAAAGALVKVVDISPKQLELDQKIASEFQLLIEVFESSADDLSMIPNESIDIIVNPLSNCFFMELESVWDECHRVLKLGGSFLYAFNNPVCYQFDFEKANLGDFRLKYAQPYSDLTSLSDVDKKRLLRAESPLEFGHTMEQQIGMLLRKGFVLTDFQEAVWDSGELINKYIPSFFHCKARKVRA